MCRIHCLPHLCKKTPTKFTLKCPEHSMWAFPSSQRQNISDWEFKRVWVIFIYLFTLNAHVSHFPRRNGWLLHSLVAVTPHWKEVWSKATWPDLGKHFHWEWTHCLSKGYSHRDGAADHITPGEQHERAKSGHSHPHTCFSFQQGQMGDTNPNRTSFLSLEPGWGWGEGLPLINTALKLQPLFNSFSIFLFIQKQLTFSKSFLS